MLSACRQHGLRIGVLLHVARGVIRDVKEAAEVIAAAAAAVVVKAVVQTAAQTAHVPKIAYAAIGS